MSAFTIILLIVLGLIALAFFYFFAVYNRLVAQRNQIKNSFSQIDVQLKRRYDLIPNLVETAKAYMQHERQTLEAVISARNTAVSAMQAVSAHPESAAAVEGLNAAEGALSGLMRQFFALSESYPDLKASENMQNLHEELVSTENKISFSRQLYNDVVMEYNITRESFPAILFAGGMGFKSAEQLASTTMQEERDPVRVSFS